MAPIEPARVVFQLFESSFKVVLIGSYLSAILFGLTSRQTHLYYRLYSDDKTWLKCFIGALWVVDLIHTVMSLHISYYYLIVCHSNAEGLLTATWSATGGLITVIITGASTNCFHIWRLYIIGNKGNSLVVTFAFLIVAARCGLAITIAVLMIKDSSFLHLVQIRSLVIATFTTCMVADASVAGSMVFCLRMNKQGIQKTNRIIDTLMTYMINMGALVEVINMICLICVICMRNNFIYLGIYGILAKLYVNSLLAFLNSRNSLRERAFKTDPGSFGMVNNSCAVTNNNPSRNINQTSQPSTNMGRPVFADIALSRNQNSYTSFSESDMFTTNPT